MNFTTLTKSDWSEKAARHAERTDLLTRDHLERKARRIKHPIDDFLFTYYNLAPAQMRRWHPGAGVVLQDAADRSEWKWYRSAASSENYTVDLESFFEKRGKTLEYIEHLFQQTMSRPPSFGCFGLHEWAMVYRLTPEQLRHRGLSLRLGATATDSVVETHPIACSHFDAYRFFTPEAKPFNTLNPTRENQPETEQSGCLHAGMDVYKWTMKLGPIIPGDLLLDTFQLAYDIRQVDMQASPYDVSDYGLPAIPIETPAGKRQYSELQKGFTKRGDELRTRVLTAIRLAKDLRFQRF